MSRGPQRATATEPLARLRAALKDRYTIERELGRGGMAVVYLALDLRHHRTVALKVLRPELAAALGPERFLREIEIAAQLTHPLILPLHDSGQADGFLFYTMPFVAGENLRDRLTRERQLPVDDALRIAREVADALGYAHALGLVHRDIKPENILFEAGHAVVSDFGIAKAIAAAGSERLTDTGLAVGTPQYMSPEQAAGSQEVDGRSDLYALGCVLYEMLSGEPPYTGPTPQAILAKKLTAPLPRISVVREAVPAGIEAALARALARTPADRYGTTADFAAALAHPEATVAPRRGRAAWLAAAALALLVVSVVTVRLVHGRGPSLDPIVVAVAPFENQIHDTALVQLGAIAADWVAQVLQGTGEIKVVPMADVPRSWTPGARVQDLADSTGAGTVITGRVSLEGDSVYLRADVVNAGTGALLYSVPPVAAAMRQPLVAVEELARRVGGAVAEIVDPAAVTSLQEVHHPNSYAAYEAFAEGVRWSYAGEWERSWQEYQRAYALDTTFLRALIAAALMHSNANDLAGDDSLVRLLERRRNELTRIEQLSLERVRADLAGDNGAAATASRELAQFLPPRTGLWGWGYFAVLANRPAEAIHALTEVNPDFQVARRWSPGSWWLAAAYHSLGRHEDELQAAERGRRLWPTSLLPIDAELRALAALGRDEDVFRLLDEARGMEPDPHHSADGFWGGAGPWQPLEAALEFRAHGHPDAYRRAIEQALLQVRLAGALDSTSVAARSGRALVLYSAERWEEARAVYASLHRGDSMNLDFIGGLGVSEARLGHRADAQALARRLAMLNPPFSRGNSQYWQARIAALVGERDRAVALLREAVADGVLCAANSWVDADCDCIRKMDFESLRGYPPFEDLLRPKG